MTELVFWTGSNAAFSVWSKGPLAKCTACLGYSVGRSWCKFLVDVGVLLYFLNQMAWFLTFDVHGDQCLPIGSVEEGCRVKVSLGRAEYCSTWIKVVFIC